jgi:hypothetical protein
VPLTEPSERVIGAAEEVVCLEEEVKAIGFRRQIEEGLDWFREREKEEQARRGAQEEADRERERKAAADRERQAWETRWMDYALRASSRENRLEVRQMVQQTLDALQPWHSDRIVQQVIDGAIEKALAPWKRRQDEQRAVNRACDRLPFDLRCGAEFAEAKGLALESARAVVAKLPEGTPYGELEAAAIRATQPTIVRYEHNRVCQRMISSTWLSEATSAENEEAKEAVRRAVGGLDVGAAVNEVEKARETVLAPYRTAIAQRRQAAADGLFEDMARLKMELSITRQLEHIDRYLESEYDYARGNGGFRERREDAARLRPIIGDTLVRECMAMAKPKINAESIRRRIEELVDEHL